MAQTVISTAERLYALEQIRRIKQMLIDKQEAERAFDRELLYLGQQVWAEADEKEKRLMVAAAFKRYAQPRAWQDYTTDERLKLITGVLYLHKRTSQIVKRIKAIESEGAGK